jgi:hypothetical protein
VQVQRQVCEAVDAYEQTLAAAESAEVAEAAEAARRRTEAAREVEQQRLLEQLRGEMVADGASMATR